MARPARHRPPERGAPSPAARAGARRPGGDGLSFNLHGERQNRPAGPEHSVFLKGRFAF